MNRRIFLGGAALATLSHGAWSAEAVQAGSRESKVDSTRYAATGTGRRPGVALLHGLRGFERKLSAYERYANALTAEGIDAYLVHFYTATDSEEIKQLRAREDREAYEAQRYVAWTERVSSAVGAILQRDDSSGRLGLLGFSLGGFVASATAERDSRVSALAVLYGGMPVEMAYQAKRMPPVIELHGEADRNVPLAAGKALVALAKAVGAPAEQVTYPGKGHGFDFADGDEAAADAVDRVAHFFKAQLGAA